MSNFRRILFPTRFEDLSFVVVQQLLALRRAQLEEIVFLYVIDRDEVSFDLYRGFDQAYADKLRAEAESRFADWAKHLATKGLKARHRIEVGSPEVEILRVAREESADLIVAGRQRQKAVDKVYLGGTSMALLRNSEIPILVAKPVEDEKSADERVHNPFQRVLFASDFSPASQRAQQLLVAMGPAIDEIDVVNVVVDGDDDPTDNEAGLEASAKALASAGTVRTHLLRGKPRQEILRLRDDHDCTSIVMGTTGKHGLREIWLGSCSHRIAEMSSVPVLLVPSPRG